MDQLQLGLIGYPLGHSRSPAIHHAAMRAVGLAGEYRLYPVPPLPEGAAGLYALVNRLRIGELNGLNMTIPHKQSVLPLLDELSLTAQAIGAVNTLLWKDDRLLGDNTDAPGFLADLQRLAPETMPAGRVRPDARTHRPDYVAPPPSALVLGAGGSARAVVYALWSVGFQVIIAARSLEEAQKIVFHFENTSVSGSERTDRSLSAMHLSLASLTNLITNLESLITHPESPIPLIVNTTPLGMQTDTNASPWPESLPFPDGAVVYDLVYNPAETLLVRRARQAGLRAFTGLGMLVEQAALAFELWTGQTAPRGVMRQAAEQV